MTFYKTLAGTAICAGLMLASFATSVRADGPVKDPQIDVTKNPGCGVKTATKAERIARNKRFAEYYFTGYLHSSQTKYGKQYNWSDYDCMSPDATVRMGFGLAPNPPLYFPKRPTPHPNVKKANLGQVEQDGVHQAYPNWGTLPGTLSIYASEDNVFYVMSFGGDAPDGSHLEYWEVDFLVINKDGKITHWDAYNDPMGVDVLFKRMFNGKGVKEVGSLENYGKLLHEKTSK